MGYISWFIQGRKIIVEPSLFVNSFGRKIFFNPHLVQIGFPEGAYMLL